MFCISLCSTVFKITIASNVVLPVDDMIDTIIHFETIDGQAYHVQDHINKIAKTVNSFINLMRIFFFLCSVPIQSVVKFVLSAFNQIYIYINTYIVRHLFFLSLHIVYIYFFCYGHFVVKINLIMRNFIIIKQLE